MMRRWIRGSKGLQTLEWVALALVVLALLGAVTAYLNGPGGAQVAAPIQQALQRYAWCLEGAGACPGAGGGNAFRTNPPGMNPLGTNPPGVNPPGANPPKGKPLDPGWCATHPRDCFSNLGKWVADRWEGVKQGAAQAWEGLKSTAEGVWKWLDEHKGLVAGGVVAGLLILGSILLTGGVALPIWLAVFGAVAFGGLYQLSGPKPGLQGWLEAFALAGAGAVMGYLLGQGGAMLAGLVKEAGWTAIWKLFVGKGIVGGVSSGISYWMLTPPDQRSWIGAGVAIGVGIITEMLAQPAAKAAVVSILGTIEATRRKELTWQTPLREFGKSFLLEQPGNKAYNRLFGRSVGKGLGWLSGKGISISPPNFVMRVANRVSWDVIKSKLFGM